MARNRAEMDSVAALCGHGAEVFPADVRSEEEVARLAADVSSRLGPVHILVNNAGVNLRKDLTDFTLEEWRSVLDTNLTGGVPDVPRVRAPAARPRLRPRHQSHVDHEPHRAAPADGVTAPAKPACWA